jgi:hypothetical protein
MRRLIWIPIACAALVISVAVIAAGAESGFDAVVSSLEQQYHVHATRVPLMGLVSLISRKATKGGVSGVRVAEFEHFNKPIDGEELNRMVEEKLGPGWERMIRSTGRHGNEQTLIFAHPEGRSMGLFVLDLDGNELDVVQVSVDPDHLNETVGKYEHRDHDRDEGESD